MNTARMTAEILAIDGWTQSTLGKRLGVSQATVSRWLKGQDPEGPTRDQLRDLHAELVVRQKPFSTFDPDAPEAQSDDGAMTVGEHTGARGIPEGSTPQLDVTAGMGAGGFILTSDGVPGKFGMTFAADHISGYWQLPDQVLTGARHTVVIPVQGNSMAPTLIEGDHVFVDTRHRWPSPDGVYALADDFGGIVVKTLRLSEHRGDDGPYIDVVSDNPDRERYPVKTRPADELRIIGRVVRRFSAVF